MGLNSGRARSANQGFRELHRGDFSGFAGDVGVNLGAIPRVLHSEAIRKARETVVVVECSVGANRPRNPAIARIALRLVVGLSVDVTIVARGRETASPPERMIMPALIKSAPATCRLFPFQLPLPHLPKIEIEAAIKG